MKKALIIVDMQNDFMPWGALPVRKADRIIPTINYLMPRFDLVVASLDWHPENHGSFASNHRGKKPGEAIALDGLEQILWPDHCVQRSNGAELVKGINVKRIDIFIKKGTERNLDSYSAFYDNGHRRATELPQILEGKRIERVYIVGVATDYCVKHTAVDAVLSGFKTILIKDACQGVNLNKLDESKAIDEMRKIDIKTITANEIIR